MEKSSFPEQWLQVFAKLSLEFFVVELGTHNKVLYSSGRATSYFGYPIEAFIGQIEVSFGELVLEADRIRVAKVIQEAKETKSDINLQFHLICSDRSISLVRIAGTYLYSQNTAPIYLFLLSDEKRGITPLERGLEIFRISFVVDTGSLIEVNLQGRIAFLVHEFANTYEAITHFASRYVHPQDRKAFSAFANRKTLVSSSATGKLQEIPFRRTSYNEAFAGYRWAMLSFSLEERSQGSGLVCDMLIQDSDNASSKLAEKTLQTQLDPLTGVLNRSALETEVTQLLELCVAESCIGAFFMLDIDQFKWVNDTFGHDYGDEVLRQVANAIREVFRPTDIVARSGGDEFAVFIARIPSTELALVKAENICRALRSLNTSGKDFPLSCSVGVSVFPKHGTSFGELYHTSDLALYKAKREGKDRYCLYGIDSYPNIVRRPIDREWLFSQIEVEVYLCNVDTYTLLFANEVLLKRLGLTSLTARGFCYEVLYGRDSPCPECKNQFLEKGQTNTWVRKDPRDGAMCLVQEKALLLKGERVKLSVSTPFSPTLSDFLANNIP